MASFIFIVAGLNLALGYLLALFLAPHFGRPRSLRRSVSTPPVVDEPAVAERVAVEPARLSRPTRDACRTPQTSDATPGEARQPRRFQRFHRPKAVDRASTHRHKPAPDAKPELVGELIEEFKDDLARYRDQLAALDRRMRAETDPDNPSAMQACLKDLRQANARHFQAQTEDSNDRLQRGWVKPPKSTSRSDAS